MRKLDCFYWVKTKYGEWTIGYRDENIDERTTDIHHSWDVVGSDECFDDLDFTEIGEKIVCPYNK